MNAKKTNPFTAPTHLFRAVTSILLIAAALFMATSQVSAQSSLPGAPTNLTASPLTPTSIKLDWDAPTTTNGTLTGYLIEKNDGMSWETLDDTSDNIANRLVPAYQDTTVPENGTRSYRVKAINANGTGPASNVVTATAMYPPMLLVEVLALKSGLGLEFNTFIDNTSRPPKSAYTLKVNGVVAPIKAINYPSAQFHYLMGIEPVTNFRPGDVITISYSKPSSNPLKDAVGVEADEFTDYAVTNNIPSTKPTAPANIEVDDGGDATSYDLTWDPAWHNGSPILRYEVRVDDETWTTVTGGDTARSHTVTGLVRGAKYRFQVRAVNVLGNGPEVLIFVPKNPVTFTFNGTNHSITRGSNVKGDQKAPFYINASGSVSIDTTFTLTWNGTPTDELHPDNPSTVTIKAGTSNIRFSLQAAPDDDDPKVYNQPVKANVVATLGSLTLSDQLVVFDDEMVANVASFSTAGHQSEEGHTVPESPRHSFIRSGCRHDHTSGHAQSVQHERNRLLRVHLHPRRPANRPDRQSPQAGRPRRGRLGRPPIRRQRRQLQTLVAIEYRRQRTHQ